MTPKRFYRLLRRLVPTLGAHLAKSRSAVALLEALNVFQPQEQLKSIVITVTSPIARAALLVW